MDNYKSYLIILLISIFIFGCQSNHKSKVRTDAFYMPAEYTSQDAVWLGWSEFEPYHQPFLDLTQSLSKHIPLKIIAVDSTSLDKLKSKLFDYQINTQNISFFIINDNRLWMRDHGATFLINQQGKKKVVDFGWTLYGNRDYLLKKFQGNMDSVNYYYQHNLGQTGSIDSIMGSLSNCPIIKTAINMEGGSIEVNGKGTLILCETVTMQRNPDLKKNYIESEFKRLLGVSHIIWLKEGLVEDPFWFNEIFEDYYGWGTYGHTDEFVRFVNDSTVLLAWVDESEKSLNQFNQENYRRMSENLKILQEANDQNGNPLQIIKVPLPDPIHFEAIVSDNAKSIDWKNRKNWKVPLDWFQSQDLKQAGDTINWVAASSYLNYLVTNEAVVLPSYIKQGSSPEKEQKVKEIFKEVFPERELIFLDVIQFNYFGGGIHCVTQQEPRVFKN